VGGDFLGEVLTPLGGASADLPVTGSRPRGNVKVLLATEATEGWSRPLCGEDAPAVINGQVRGKDGEEPLGLLTKLLSVGGVAYEKVLGAFSKVFGSSSKDASDPHNVSYIADTVAFGLIAKTYSDFFYGRSKDGGETIPDSPGPGSMAVIGHAKVSEGLNTVCERVAAGEITRSGPDGFLGLLRLNGAWWRTGEKKATSDAASSARVGESTPRRASGVVITA